MPKSTHLIEGPVSRHLVLATVSGERDYQDAVWCAATTPTEGKQSPTEFLVYIQHYLNEAVREASTAADPASMIAVLDNVRKLSALAVACMEQNGVVPRDPEQFPGDANGEPVVVNELPDDEIPF